MKGFPVWPREDAEGTSPKQRAISAVEMCVAIAVVVSHNVFHWIPNEVPILSVMAVASFRFREGNWGFRLFARPESWLRTVLLAGLCVLLFEAKDLLLEALRNLMGTTAARESTLITQSHDIGHALQSLLFIWLFAAFGEEIGYRGYLLRRALDVFGWTRWGMAIALIIASATFGLGHFYKGLPGVMDSTGSGLILGGAYLLSHRLWASTLAHGLNDTLAVMLTYFGW